MVIGRLARENKWLSGAQATAAPKVDFYPASVTGYAVFANNDIAIPVAIHITSGHGGVATPGGFRLVPQDLELQHRTGRAVVDCHIPGKDSHALGARGE